MVKSLPGTGFGDGVTALLVIVNQDGQQFGKLLFFRRGSLEFIEAKQFTGEALAFVIRADDMRKRPPQQLPVCFLVQLWGDCAHCFHVPRSYSECVRRCKTKTICAL